MSVLEVVISNPKDIITEPEDPPSNVTVITHGRCTDGFCAAWVAQKVFPDANIIFAQFGESPPDTKGRETYILDFSYKRKILQSMYEQSKTLTVLDHHITAEADLAGLPYCYFNMNKSGSGMTWCYFNNCRQSDRSFDGSMPWLVQYVQDRDLGKHELADTRCVNAVISSYPFDFETWDELSHRKLSDVKKEGCSILRFQEQMASDMVRYAREVELDGYRVLAVNSSVMNSDVGCMLADNRPFGVVWFQREDGKYSYSLRSNKKGVDVSKIALHHGGGGHAQSAGFLAERSLF
jgi:oligoribonuclease NrnB/cAMP/cGMP phosphodiesterase (DHH superfamily)